MSRLKNTLLLALLVAVAGYAGIKGYLYYKVKTRIDNMAIHAAPYLGIEYGGISTRLDGTLTLEQVTLRPRAVDDSIRIESLTIITPGLGFLLNGTRSGTPAAFPDRLGLVVRGLRIDLQGEMISAFHEAEAQRLGFVPGKGLVCTFSQSFLAEQYRELGLQELLLDADIEFEQDRNNTGMRVSMRSELQGIEAWDMQFAFRPMSPSGIAMVPFVPALSSFSVSYRPNPVFTQQVNQYCATLKGTTVADFIAQLVQQGDADYMQDIGFVPGPGIRAALQQLLAGASELRISAHPQDPIDLSKVHLYQARDIPDLLGLHVSVDGQAIDDLSLRQTAQPRSRDTTPAPSFNTPLVEMLRNAMEPDTPTADTATPEKPRAQTGTYRLKRVEAAQLGEMIGRDARITTRDGRIRSGRIIQLERGTVSLQTRLHGGTMSVHIPLQQVSGIEVQVWEEQGDNGG